MKLKLVGLTLVVFLSSGIYALASSNEQPTVMNNVIENTEEVQSITQTQSYMFRQGYRNQLSVEEHELFVTKQIELMNTILKDYELMSSSERQVAEIEYHRQMQEFMSDLLDYEVNWSRYDMNRYGHMMTQEEHEAVMLKKIELTNQFLANYDSMTTEERQEAERRFYDDLQNYMVEFMSENGTYGNCHGGNYSQSNGDYSGMRRGRRSY